MVPQASMSGDQHQPPAPIRRGLQWQTPYTGPRYALPPQVTPTAHLSTGGFSPFPVQEPPVLQDPKLAHSDTPQTASTLLAEPTSGIQ